MRRHRSIPGVLIVVGALFLAVPAFGASSFKFNKADLNLLHESDLLDQRLASEGLVYEDAATTHYVESVGRSLLPPGPPPEHVKWKFRVLRDADPNAFALPNGSVYIDTGLLSLMRNESQLAGVLGHEETHVLKRHAYLERRNARKKAVTLGILRAAGYWAGMELGVSGLVASAISSVASDLVVATIYGYSREMEREADMRGLEAMEKAGYQPEGMVATLQLLEKTVGQDHSPALYRDHPRLEARMEYLKGAIKANPPGPGPFRVGAKTYDKASEAVCVHDFKLEIMEGHPRRAVAIAHHLIDDHPTSENYRLLGDAYRAMGGRLPDPSAQQISAERKHARKMLRYKTHQEYEKALLSKRAGKAAWKENREQADAAYQKAIQLDSSDAKAYRGLGFIYEDEQITYSRTRRSMST